MLARLIRATAFGAAVRALVVLVAGASTACGDAKRAGVASDDDVGRGEAVVLAREAVGRKLAEPLELTEVRRAASGYWVVDFRHRVASPNGRSVGYEVYQVFVDSSGTAELVDPTLPPPKRLLRRP